MRKATFARLSTGVWTDEQFNTISFGAKGLWAMMLAYCVEQLNDGEFSDHDLRRVAPGERGVNRWKNELIGAGLWGQHDTSTTPGVQQEYARSTTGVQQYYIKRFTEHQQTRAQVDTKRAAQNARKQASRDHVTRDTANMSHATAAGRHTNVRALDIDKDKDTDKDISSSSVVNTRTAVDNLPVDDDDVPGLALAKAATIIAQRLGKNPARYRAAILGDVLEHRGFAERVFAENVYCGQPLRPTELATVIVAEHMGEPHAIRLEATS